MKKLVIGVVCAVACAGLLFAGTSSEQAPAPKPLNPVTAAAQAEPFITQQLIVAQEPVKGTTFAPIIYVIFVAVDGRVDIEPVQNVLDTPTLNLLYTRLHLMGREQLVLVSRNCPQRICT